MKILKTISELRSQLGEYNLEPVGLVPTMGALHDGHIYLAGTAVRQCPVVVVTIFVNPTQFNDKNDLKNYPRTIESDMEMLGKVLRGKDLVFTPLASEIYPEEDKRKFLFGNLDNVMEALHRPGHFNGVAQVVSRLFEIVEPDIAFFGIKDFQQLAVIKSLVSQINNKVRIVPVPIVRENDGLAMSSRNRLLEPEIRKNASVIFRTLTEASKMMADTEISDIKSYVEDKINEVPGFEVEYFEIADDEELIPLKSRKEIKAENQYYGCIAVRAGKIRLIDNIKFNL